MKAKTVSTLEILERLVAFPSVSANSNLPIIGFIDDFLKARGFEVFRIPDATGLKAGIFARKGGTDTAGVMLSAHTDVVPVEGQNWTVDPFRLRVENGKAYGRGTTDMKGYLASALALADRASRVTLTEPLKFSFSYDEEIGCVGIKPMIKLLRQTVGVPRVCIVGEPTMMDVAVGHKGKAALRAVCHGENGHSALAPKFLNAISLASKFIDNLSALQQNYARNGQQDAAYSVPYSTIHVGKISGGTALNIVPDKAVIDFEYRHLAQDNPNEILERINLMGTKAAQHFASEHPGANITIDQYNAYPGLNSDAKGPQAEYIKTLAQRETTTKVAFGTEAGCFANELGIDTFVCGPGSMEEQGHKPDECITLDQLNLCDQMNNRLLKSISA